MTQTVLLEQQYLPAYTDLVHGPLEPDRRAHLIARIEEMIGENHPSTQNIVLSLDDDGVPGAHLIQQGSGYHYDVIGAFDGLPLDPFRPTPHDGAVLKLERAEKKTQPIITEIADQNEIRKLPLKGVPDQQRREEHLRDRDDVAGEQTSCARWRASLRRVSDRTDGTTDRAWAHTGRIDSHDAAGLLSSQRHPCRCAGGERVPVCWREDRVHRAP